MGWKLAAEVADHAPADLTWREYAALLVLAGAAWDTGPRARQIPGIESNPALLRRLRIPSRSRRFETLQALVAKGALERIERGRRGTGATYAIPSYAAAKGPGFQDPMAGAKGPGFGVDRVPVLGSKGPGFQDPQQTTTRQQPEVRAPRARARDHTKASNGTAQALADIEARAEVGADDAQAIFDAVMAEYAARGRTVTRPAALIRAIPGPELASRLEPGEHAPNWAEGVTPWQ